MFLLLVEDDLNLGRALSRRLEGTHRVHWVRTLEAARMHLEAEDYEIMLLDLGLPDGDALAWLRSLREGNAEGVDSNALEVHIHRLRKLIGAERIETVRGFGYRLTVP